MLKYVVVAVFSICVLPCFAVAQDCGCGGSIMDGPIIDAPVVDHGVDMGISDCGCDAAPAPSCGAPRTRKRLSLTMESREVCRMKRVCSTDCCGCPTSKFVRSPKTVSRPKLSMVDAPARERCCCSGGGRLRGMIGRLGSMGGGGGCGAPAADCGCEAAPVADCGCEAAPVSDCGCGS